MKWLLLVLSILNLFAWTSTIAYLVRQSMRLDDMAANATAQSWLIMGMMRSFPKEFNALVNRTVDEIQKEELGQTKGADQ